MYYLGPVSTPNDPDEILSMASIYGMRIDVVG